MNRRIDWQERLGDFLEANRAQVFAWGRWDCCIFAAGAVEAMTGTDPMSEFRGRYSTARGSAVALGRYGAGNLADTLTAKFGAPIAPAMARRGDLVMVDGSVGVVLGGEAVMVGREGEREGLLLMARPTWEAAWGVPF